MNSSSITVIKTPIWFLGQCYKQVIPYNIYPVSFIAEIKSIDRISNSGIGFFHVNKYNLKKPQVFYAVV